MQAGDLVLVIKNGGKCSVANKKYKELIFLYNCSVINMLSMVFRFKKNRIVSKGGYNPLEKF